MSAKCSVLPLVFPLPFPLGAVPAGWVWELVLVLVWCCCCCWVLPVPFMTLRCGAWVVMASLTRWSWEFHIWLWSRWA